MARDRHYPLRILAMACTVALCALLLFTLTLPRPDTARERRDAELRALEESIDDAVAARDEDRYWALRERWWEIAARSGGYAEGNPRSPAASGRTRPATTR